MGRKVCFVLLVIGIGAVSGLNVSFTDCGSNGASINYVSLKPCIVDPCKFKVGSVVDLTINFNATKGASKPVTTLFVMTRGVPKKMEIPKDACVDNVKCPITRGSPPQNFTVFLTLPEQPINTAAILEISEDNADPLFCVAFPFSVIA